MNFRSSGLMLIFVATFLVGCANDRVIVDTKGVDQARYQTDLAECETYATQISTAKEAGEKGLIGAVVGGAIGAVVGNHRTAEQIAGAGAVSGAARGAGSAEARKDQIVRNCLRGRGYKVLG